MMITLMHTDKIMAATSSGYAANGVQKNVTEYLPTGQNGENTTVGRYALNYTGMRIRGGYLMKKTLKRATALLAAAAISLSAVVVAPVKAGGGR